MPLYSVSPSGTIISAAGYDTGVPADQIYEDGLGNIYDFSGNPISDETGYNVGVGPPVSTVSGGTNRPTDVVYDPPINNPIIGTIPGTETPIDNGPSSANPDPFWSGGVAGSGGTLTSNPNMPGNTFSDFLGGFTGGGGSGTTAGVLGGIAGLLGTGVIAGLNDGSIGGGGGGGTSTGGTSTGGGFSSSQSAIDFIRQMSDPALQNLLLQNETTYRPQYTALNLQDIKNYLQGVGGQPGALDLLGTSTQRIGEIQTASNTAQRAADIADVANLGPAAAAAFKAANPELYAQLAKASNVGVGQNPYAQLEQALGSQQQFGDVNVNQVGQGQLGQQLYQQALGAGGLGEVGTALQGRAKTLAASTGTLTPEELRNSQQSIRAAYASRGTEMGSGAVSAEALGRLANERQRMMEDLQMASALNQAGQAELTSNRGFQTGVYGQELGRGFSNQSSQLQTDLANRQFQATQQQQQVQNLGLLGQLQQGQTAAERAYQLQILQAQAGMSFDPMQAILGRSSGSIGIGQQQQGFGASLTQNLQGSQLFDPNAGVNLGLMNYGNAGTQSANQSGVNSANQGYNSAAIFGAIGNLGKSLFG